MKNDIYGKGGKLPTFFDFLMRCTSTNGDNCTIKKNNGGAEERKYVK